MACEEDLQHADTAEEVVAITVDRRCEAEMTSMSHPLVAITAAMNSTKEEATLKEAVTTKEEATKKEEATSSANKTTKLKIKATIEVAVVVVNSADTVADTTITEVAVTVVTPKPSLSPSTIESSVVVVAVTNSAEVAVVDLALVRNAAMEVHAPVETT